MNPDSRTDNKGDTNLRTKATAAIPVAGILVAAALLSFIGSSYQSALSQQDLIGNTITTTPTNTTTTNPTMAGAGQSSACAPTQTGGSGIAMDTITGGGGDATTGTTNATSTATTAGEGGVNQSTTSEVRLHIEEACMALQAGDAQGVLMHLNLALNALGDGTQGNITSETTAGPETSTGGGGTIEAGTAGDEPGTTEDEPGTTGEG
jgi:hypothetical protein